MKEVIKIILTVLTFGLNKLILRKKKRDLKNHPIFFNIRYYIEIKLKNLPIEDQLKKKTVVSFLTIKFKVLENLLLRSLCDKTLDPNKVNYASAFMEGIKEYEYQCYKEKIPQIFIDKFQEWHKPVIEVMLYCIEKFCNSDYHATTYEKQAAILDVAMGSLAMTIINAENTLNDMNGELEEALRELKND